MRKTLLIFVETGEVTELHMAEKAVDALIDYHVKQGWPVEDLRRSGVWSVLIYPQAYQPKAHLLYSDKERGAE
mgnify:CR=1 FL=1